MKPPTTAEVLRNILDRIKSGEELSEAVVEYRHVAGEISAYGATFAEALQKRDARRKSRPAERLTSCTPRPLPNNLTTTMKILTRDDTEHDVEYVTRADAEREIESWKERARLTFDEECVWHFALRYALPRTSTASTIVSEFIRANMGRIDPRTLRQMAEEIEEAIRRGLAGHAIDVTIWRRLADDIYSATCYTL